MNKLEMFSPEKPLDRIKHNVNVQKGSAVCNKGVYIGDIYIGTGTVVHPHVQIHAEAGPIVIGENNLIEEMVQIINRLPEGVRKSEEQTLIIGNNNVFEVGCNCQANKVGNNNILEVKSHVGPGVELTNGCVIGAHCSVTLNEVLPEKTVIYGEKHLRRTRLTMPTTQESYLELLGKLLRNNHFMIKPKKLVIKTKRVLKC